MHGKRLQRMSVSLTDEHGSTHRYHSSFSLDRLDEFEGSAHCDGNLSLQLIMH